MRSEAIGKRTARRVARESSLVEFVTNKIRIATKDRQDARARAKAKEGTSVRERQEELVSFYEHYENLVETLCDAAQYGPGPNLQTAYARERAWMQEHYRALRPFLMSYLSPSSDDQEPGAPLSLRRPDSFEALVAADSLDAFLSSDDGGMISRITRTRQALTFYGEHLRQLAARTE